jgi:myosin heavy subunit
VMGKEMENKMWKLLCVGVVALLILGLMESGVAVSQQALNEDNSGLNGQALANGQQEQVEQQTQNAGENKTIRIQQRAEVRAQNASELHEMVEQRKQEMNQDIQALEEHQQLVYQNQNRVRLAVHSLLAMEELVGGIGPQVSQIAEGFNMSVQATIRAEEQIQSRNGFVRFFAGGDDEAAQEIEQQVIQNQERIRQLRQLSEECDCDEEVRAMLQEQIQTMEPEQARLQQLAQDELTDKGLFGGFWGR